MTWNISFTIEDLPSLPLSLLPLPPSLPPSLPQSTEHCMGTVKLAEQFRHRGVVGVDIVGDELLPLDPRHVEGFKEAKRLGFHVTVHAAESGPASNVKQVRFVCSAYGYLLPSPPLPSPPSLPPSLPSPPLPSASHILL